MPAIKEGLYTWKGKFIKNSISRRKPEVADIYKIPVFFINNGEEALAGILGAI